MKNNNIDKFFQQKNFYFALYSCVIAIILLATVNTYTSLDSSNSKQNKNISHTVKNKNAKKNISQENKFTQEAKPVLNNKTKNYLAPEDKVQDNKNQNLKDNKVAQKNINTQDQNKNKPESQNFYAARSIQSFDQNKNTESITASTSIQDQNINLVKQDTDHEFGTNTENENKNILGSDQDNQQVFNLFNEDQKMDWPLIGQIVMDYDKENLVYDKTLEQYRTNDSLSLAAKVGDQVKASADGIVKLITKTDEGGNTIVIDHGNDWTSIYSQLQDNLLVNEGDLVKKGQVIGGVNSPTKYGILLGSHLDFKITHEDNAINPKTILSEK